MPEMHVRLRWPDGTRDRVYSPSLVLAEHLDEGASYPRVRARYGVPCGRAAASLAGIEARVRQYEGGDVLVEAVET